MQTFSGSEIGKHFQAMRFKTKMLQIYNYRHHPKPCPNWVGVSLQKYYYIHKNKTMSIIIMDRQHQRRLDMTTPLLQAQKPVMAQCIHLLIPLT